LGNQAVNATGQFAVVRVGGFEEAEDGLVEIVAARHDAVHVMFLVLHRAEQQRVLQVHHFRHAAAFRAEEFALRGRGAINHLIRRAKIFAEQFRACRPGCSCRG
jgi:hypothetical protein